MILNHLSRNRSSLIFLAVAALLIIVPASSLDCYYPLKKSPNNSACIKPCSDYQFYYEGQNACRDHCPSLGHQWTVQGVKICQLPCSSNLILHLNGKNQQCLEECPSGFKVDEIDSIRQCVKICPEDQFYTELGSSQCLQDCPLVEETAQGAKLCKFPCQKSEFWNPGTNECSSECLAPLVKETVADVHLCKYPCQKGEFWDQGAKTCNKTCSSPYWIRSGHSGYQFCEKPCNSDDLYWIKETRQCEKECPEYWVPSALGNVKICKFPCSRDYYYNTQNEACQDSCLVPWIPKQDPKTKAKICYNNCKSDEILLDDSCVKECPFPWKTQTLYGITFCAKPCAEFQFWDNATLSCRNSCPEYMDKEYINKIRSCLPKCNKSEYYLFHEDLCSPSCPEPLIPDFSDEVNSCHQPCPQGDAYDPKTKTCVRNCPPLTEEKYFDHVLTCTPACAEGLIFSPFGCVKTCEEPSVLIEEDGVEFCQLDCPEGSFVLHPWKECVASCPKTHEQKLGRKMNKYLQEEYVDECQPRCNNLIPLRLENGECYSPQEPLPFAKWNYPFPQACPEGEILEIHAGYPICRKPCHQHEYWNEVTLACEKSCPQPWKSREINNTLICFKPCGNSEFYLIGMQICSSACPNSWIPEVSDGINLCKQPCGPSEYFHPENRSCLSSCPRSWGYQFIDPTDVGKLSRIRVQLQDLMRICEKPCGPDSFRFRDDETCGLSCPEYWTTYVQDEVLFCGKPCSWGYQFWIEKENRCVDYCPLRFESITKNDVNVCIEKCAEGEMWWDSKCVEDPYTPKK